MAIDIYDLVVPVMSRMATNIGGFLNKGQAHAETRRVDPKVLLDARLAPDMFTFTRQIQIVTDFCKATPARLAGVEIPAWEDTERSFDELQARVQRARDYLGSFERAQFKGAETRQIELELRSGTYKLKGKAYLLDFALPNFYFHATTAYGILRHCGVELGKLDYMGPIGGR